ncbi:MAG TPA: mechanosensitive ion channel protein [Prolixibacteraceae bacterium]|jgi:small conductance mechanosensitive channel|nr:mechanosensitive ion channel protein [Prolixibacteraceae bacterium]
MNQIDNYFENIKTMVLNYLPSLIMSLVVLIVGWWIIGRIGKAASFSMKKMDESLRSFLRSIITVVLKVLLLISVAGMVGIQTTSFIAIIGAAGLAVGLALQGTLANFAGGVLILMFKPYKIGDVIESLGKTGMVKEIQIFNTVLNTPKGETIILPNGAVSNGTLVNYTHLGSALVEIPADLASNTNIEDLRRLILPVIAQDECIYTDPQPSIGIVALKPGIVTVAFRAFTLPQNLPSVTGRMIETIKTELHKNNIADPIPHSFVHSIAEANQS